MSLGKLNNAREALAIARECRSILGGNGITLEYPATGGHVGFVGGRPPGHTRWLASRVARFLDGTHAG